MYAVVTNPGGDIDLIVSGPPSEATLAEIRAALGVRWTVRRASGYTIPAEPRTACGRSSSLAAR